MSKNKVADALAKLALMIAEEANMTNVVDGDVGGEPHSFLTFDQRVAAFKALTVYYVNTTKAKAKIPDDDEEGGTMGDISKRLRAVS
jgi:hypothetical protein